jgi:hypothetical protein
MNCGRQPPFARVLALLSLSLLAVLTAPAAPFGQNTGYPGAAPGRFAIQAGPGSIVASNAALFVFWELGPHGL